MDKLKADFDETPFILLGDENDNPDDESLNILETGNPNAPAGPEEIQGPFLINLTEPLCAAGHVSHGLKTDAVQGDFLNTIDAGSRDRNNVYRGTNTNTGDILFDQILIPAWMIDSYVPDSCRVFDNAVAAKGNERNRASDHVPVYADFIFVPESEPVEVVEMIRIVSLLPNPEGRDDNHEQITLSNTSANDITLTDWKLMDKADNSYDINVTIPANSTLTVILNRSAMLNNLGDEIWLVDSQGNVKPSITYTAAQAKPGEIVIVN